MKKRSLRIIIFSLLCAFLFGFTAQAATQITNTKTKNYAFWSPDSGTSSLKLSMTYVEDCTTSGSQNIFNRHLAMYGYNVVGATKLPTLAVNNITHYNGSSTLKTFSLSSTSVVTDPIWSYGGGRINTTSVTYSTTSQNTGKVNYTINCSGFTPPYYMDTVDVILNPR